MNTPQNFVIVAFGDSITQAVEVPEEQRWPALLEAALSQEQSTQVVNCGVGGNTSREGLARMESVLSCEPNFVLVEFGGNDATDDSARYVPLDEFSANLTAMHAQFQLIGATMAPLTFPPVVNDWTVHSANDWHKPYGGVDEHIEKYRAATRDFAAQNQLLLIDIDRALREAAKADGWEKYFQPDGVHLTQGGNQIIAEKVRQSLVESGFAASGVLAP